MKRASALLLVFSNLCACAHGAGGATASSGEGSTEREASVLITRGREYAELGDYVRAEQYFAAAIAAGADESKVLPLLFRACVQGKHYRLAADYAEVALARHPDSPQLRFLTGALYVAIGQAAKARELLEGAARLKPQDAELQFAIGVVLRDDLDDKPAADEHFREYIRLSPQGAHAVEAKASLMQRLEPERADDP